jgi:hypothetical protein
VRHGRIKHRVEGREAVRYHDEASAVVDAVAITDFAAVQKPKLGGSEMRERAHI